MPEPRARRGTLSSLAQQVRYQTLMFLRAPRALFFTIALPVLFLFLFNSLLGGDRIDQRGGLKLVQFFTPSIAAFGVISVCYTGLAISVAMAREELVLKRVRGTPLPPWLYMGGRIGSMVLISLAAVAVMFATSVPAYDVRFFAGRIGAMAVTLVVGAICFSALGLAVTTLVTSSEGAPATVNATLFPILFISDVFIPVDEAPEWLRGLGWVFPIKHFSRALQDTFDPSAGAGIAAERLLVMAAWAVAGTLLAVRFFRWEPTPGAGRRRRARRRTGAEPA